MLLLHEKPAHPLRLRAARGFLKEEIQSRKWNVTMPGESWLVTELFIEGGTIGPVP